MHFISKRKKLRYLSVITSHIISTNTHAKHFQITLTTKAIPILKIKNKASATIYLVSRKLNVKKQGHMKFSFRKFHKNLKTSRSSYLINYSTSEIDLVVKRFIKLKSLFNFPLTTWPRTKEQLSYYCKVKWSPCTQENCFISVFDHIPLA